jgi:hypothetical protein
MASEAAVEIARTEWRDGEQRLETEARAGPRYRALIQQVDVVVDELRRRVGQTFTLAELTAAYAEAERWSGDALEDAGSPAWWPRTHTLVQAAAFARYARGAVDYKP